MRGMRGTRVVLTGVPGVGKSTLAKMLSKKLGCECIDASKFVESRKLYSKRLSTGELMVNTHAAEKAFKKFLAGKKSFVIHGHLLCEMRLPCDVAVVLRCRPEVLWKRLESRRYRAEKIRENLLAEVLDYCKTKADANYRNVIQIDNTKPITSKKLLERVRSGENDFVDYSRFILGNTRVSRFLRSVERQGDKA